MKTQHDLRSRSQIHRPSRRVPCKCRGFVSQVVHLLPMHHDARTTSRDEVWIYLFQLNQIMPKRWSARHSFMHSLTTPLQYPTPSWAYWKMYRKHHDTNLNWEWTCELRFFHILGLKHKTTSSLPVKTADDRILSGWVGCDAGELLFFFVAVVELLLEYAVFLMRNPCKHKASKHKAVTSWSIVANISDNSPL